MKFMLFHMYDTTNDFWWTEGEWIYNLGRDLARRYNLPARSGIFALPVTQGKALETLMESATGYNRLPGPVYIEEVDSADFYMRFPSFLEKETEPLKDAAEIRAPFYGYLKREAESADKN